MATMVNGISLARRRVVRRSGMSNRVNAAGVLQANGDIAIGELTGGAEVVFARLDGAGNAPGVGVAAGTIVGETAAAVVTTSAGAGICAFTGTSIPAIKVAAAVHTKHRMIFRLKRDISASFASSLRQGVLH